ncbi:MAG: L,D-transpeptidase [Caldilineaceae bacterium]
MTTCIYFMPRLLRWQHDLHIALRKNRALPLVIPIVLLSLVQPKFAFAQDVRGAAAGKTTFTLLTQDPQRPILSEHDNHVPDAGDTSKPAGAKALRPPLPFRAPHIGPLIKRVSMDNIAQRTTAFIPTSLENLTDIDPPQEKKWIRVDLSEQTVVAYENGQPIRAFIVSTGLPGTPTVRGEFRIRVKVLEQTMSGGEGSMFYNLPGVKWVQYFYEDYGFHGTYWHSNFGHPMSHGCVNMTDADAKWLFDWAGPVWDGETDWYRSTEENPGTLVLVTE